MATLIWQRDVADVKSTFGSWDKCMTKTYCKWPVIAAIIIGSLVLFSVLFCIFRCICCGAECACCCFRCCSGCCGSGRSRGHKKMSSASAPPPMPGYQPAYQGTPVNSQYRSHASPSFEKPQYATFETPSKPVNPDALPAMPSWDQATSRKVEEEVVPEKPGDVEMNNLAHKGSASEAMLTGATGAPPRSPARSPVYQSPTHAEPAYAPPYQPNDGYAGQPPQRGPRSPESFRSGQQTGVVDQYNNQQLGYGNRMNPSPSISPVYEGASIYGQNQQFGRNSPRPGGQNQEYGRGSPRPGVQNQEFGRSSPRPVIQNQQYGRNPPRPGGHEQEYEHSSPRPAMGAIPNYNNAQPTPQARGYGPPPPAPGRVNSPLAPYQAYEAPQAAPFQDVRNNYTAPQPYAELDTGYTAPKPYAELDTGYGANAHIPSEPYAYAPSCSTRVEAPSPYQNNYNQPQELDSGNWPSQHYNGQQYHER